LQNFPSVHKWFPKISSSALLKDVMRIFCPLEQFNINVYFCIGGSSTKHLKSHWRQIPRFTCKKQFSHFSEKWTCLQVKVLMFTHMTCIQWQTEYIQGWEFQDTQTSAKNYIFHCSLSIQNLSGWLASWSKPSIILNS
jgi:hypothetical protein